MAIQCEYWQRGETIDHANAGAAIIKHGDVVVIGPRVGVAGDDIEPGETGSLHVAGVFIMPKAAEALTVGAAAFWDAEAKAITTTEDSNAAAGWIVEPAASADSTAKIKIG